MASDRNKLDDLFKAPKMNDDRPVVRTDVPNKRKSDGPSLPSKEVLELAYKIKAEEAKEKQKRIAAVHLRRVDMRHKGLIQFGITGLLLAFCFGAYLIYSDMRIKTKIVTVEANLINKINSAYQGDPIAHEEIVRRIPVLTKTRLAKNSKRAESDSASLDQSKLLAPSVDIAPEIEVKTVVVPVEIYSSQEPGAPSLGRLLDDTGIIDIKYGPDWSSIMLANGFPLWIHADFVSETGQSILKVKGARVNLRIQPDLSPNSVVGRVNDGDSLQILGQSGSWYQVNSPADLKGWVKTQDLKGLL